MDNELKKETTKLLKSSNLFAKLKKNELEIVARYSEYYSYKKGDVIFNEGSSADELYIIQEGEVSISKISYESKPLELARFISGECFGELDLLDNAPRTASATSVKDSTLLVFPKKDIIFQNLITEHPALFAQILYKFLATVAGRIRSMNRVLSQKAPWVEDLKKQLYRDKLTGLYNRTYMDDEFGTLLSKNQDIYIIVVKPDNFKIINDTYGHEAGDSSLKFLAEIFPKFLTKEDIPVRYKGDEYIGILCEKDETKVKEMAQEIINGISAISIANITKGPDFYIKMSVGIVYCKNEPKDPAFIIKKAYEKMFEARNSGGNTLRI